jgi:hypothetical protein
MCYLKHQYIIETSYNLITDNLHSQYSLQRRQFYNTVTSTLFLHLWCHLQFYICDILWPLSIFAISHGLKIRNPWKYSSSESVDGMKRNLNKKKSFGQSPSNYESNNPMQLPKMLSILLKTMSAMICGEGLRALQGLFFSFVIEQGLLFKPIKHPKMCLVCCILICLILFRLHLLYNLLFKS